MCCGCVWECYSSWIPCWSLTVNMFIFSQMLRCQMALQSIHPVAACLFFCFFCFFLQAVLTFLSLETYITAFLSPPPLVEWAYCKSHTHPQQLCEYPAYIEARVLYNPNSSILVEALTGKSFSS